MIANKSITYNEYGLEIAPNASLSEIKHELNASQLAAERLPYAIGDCLVHLSTSGDKNKESLYKLFISENKSRATVQNYFKVCKTFQIKEREKYAKTLSFTHLVESLEITKDKAKASKLLDIALAESLSVSQMRAVFRRTVSAAQTEPEIDLSPVVELARLASELSRKLAATELNSDESDLLFKELKPIAIWLDNHLAKKE
jgi:hypothetical protein